MNSSCRGDDAFKLTNNEKVVLRMLLGDGRISDVDIASKLKVSSQAVSKIRKKLKGRRVIDGHVMNLNYGALGMDAFALALFDTSDLENYLEDDNILP